MLSKQIVLLLSILCSGIDLWSQNCELTLRGQVYDKFTGKPISYVNVLLQENSVGTVTDENGEFLLSDICAGTYHLIASHVACDSRKIHLDILRDTTIEIGLILSPTSLGAIVIEGAKDISISQPSLSIKRQNIEDNSNQSLSSLLQNETGVHLIKNGSGISKPVVHGLYGNRLTILNNGIVQSGQQWGNDHSPEIDPFAADKIVILKGASAIQYGGNNLGSVILVAPKSITREPHLHGQVSYIYDTNGRGHSLNARLEKYNPSLSWRINGTLKNYGDRSTRDYFLTNTGSTEANFSVQLEKSWNDKLFIDFYGSTFNTSLGILRGSHIGNLTDLEQALTRDIPFFTEDDFSRNIVAPKQDVSHHLVKGKVKYYIRENQPIEFVLAGQVNNRKEFDVRRSGRTDIPGLSLVQYTTNIETKYSNNFKDNWKLTVGNQNIITDNTNNPETGILPLIPDYFSWQSGWFATLSKSIYKSHFNLGVRYDYQSQNVATISNDIPKEIIRYNNQYHNTSGLFAYKLDISKKQSIALNSGITMRNPSINELYSNGLHQGVSGIEEGDITLKTENAVKTILEYKWLPTTNFSFSALAYHQHFNNYIYLNPQDEVRLTIRGAFPVFKYEQTDARIYGFDLSTQFTISNSILAILRYSYLKGYDISNHQPLVFMPPNSLFGSLAYQIKDKLKLTNKIVLSETELEINNSLVLKQNHILLTQDFVPPPPTYNLLGLKLSSNVIFSDIKMRFFIKADNIFNVRYRDYLNRQRYFADDLGRSITLGLNIKF